MGHQLPNDLLFQILLLLPAKFIFRFKCVSKNWKRLISDHQFCRQYLGREGVPLLGFFQFKSTKYMDQDHTEEEQLSLRMKPCISFLPTYNQGNQGVRLNSSDFAQKLGFFFASSGGFAQKLGFFFASAGGLILCGRHPSNYYVANPITDQWFELPPPNITTPPSGNRFYTIGFYCEQQLDHPDYIVVRAETNQFSYEDKIETYSSETGVWRYSRLTSSPDSGIPPCQLSTFFLAIKGTFFWYTYCKRIAAYDPETAAANPLWLITKPRLHCPCCVPTLGESHDGRLQCATHDVFDDGVRIFVLEKKLSCYPCSARLEVSEWTSIHVVRVKIRRCTKFELVHPFLVAFHPHNSRILFLGMADSIFVCDIRSGRVNLVSYQGTLFSMDIGFKILPYFLPEWPPSPLP